MEAQRNKSYFPVTEWLSQGLRSPDWPSLSSHNPGLVRVPGRGGWGRDRAGRNCKLPHADLIRAFMMSQSRGKWRGSPRNPQRPVNGFTTKFPTTSYPRFLMELWSEPEMKGGNRDGDSEVTSSSTSPTPSPNMPTFSWI